MASKQWKHPVVLREIKCSAVKNLLEIEGKIIQDEHSFTATFFLSIFEDFVRQDENKKLVMQFSPFELLALKVAIKEALGTNKAPSYRNYTGGKDNGKWLTVNVSSGKDEVMQYSLNFEKKGKLIGMIFSRYEALAITDVIDEVYGSVLRKRDEIAWSKYMKIFTKSKDK